MLANQSDISSIYLVRVDKLYRSKGNTRETQYSGDWVITLTHKRPSNQAATHKRSKDVGACVFSGI